MNREDYRNALNRIKASDSAKKRAVAQMKSENDNPIKRRTLLSMLPAYAMAALAMATAFWVIFRPGAQQPDSSPPPSLTAAPSESSPSPSPEVTTRPTLRHTPLPVLETLDCDMDGDGKRESVVLKGADEVVLTELYALCDGESVTFDETIRLETPTDDITQMCRPAKVADLDGDGGDEIVIYVDRNGYEYWGSMYIITLTVKNGVLSQFECLSEAKYAPVLNTLLPEYDAATMGIDPICGAGLRVNAERGTVEVAQYVWLEKSDNGMGFLVTEQKLGANGYEVVSQRIEGMEYATARGNDLFVKDTIDCDVDGDGISDTVRVKSVRRYRQYEGECYVECDEPQLYFMIQADVGIGYYWASIANDLDGDGGDELIFQWDRGGTGGDLDVITVTWKDGEVKQYYMGGWSGYSGKGRLVDGFMAELDVNETGRTYTFPLRDQSMPLPEILEIYGTDGTLLREEVVGMDGIATCLLNIDDDGIVTIGQQVYYLTHPNTAGCLVTRLRFGTEGYEVVSQSVEGPDYMIEHTTEWVVVDTAQCDLDGDGTMETVEIVGEYDSVCMFYLRFICGGVYVFESIQPYVFMGTSGINVADLDGDGGDELAIALSLDANGGEGGYNVTVLTFKNGVLRRLPVPDGDGWNDTLPECKGGDGFTASARLLDDYGVEVNVNETGYTERFTISVDQFPLGGGAEEAAQYYDADSKLLQECTDITLDRICFLKVYPERGTIEIAQYLWFGAHVNGIGFLVSELTYGPDGYEVVSQRIEDESYADTMYEQP